MDVAVSQPSAYTGGVTPFLCIGHRGAAGYEPENTLRSIRRALELGAHGVEVDVYFVDGQLVVFHDAKLERTTNGRGALVRKTFAHLRTLDAGHGERIPTLREVFETVDRRAFINIELKGRRTAAPVATLVGEFLDRRGWSCEHFLISSFNRIQLRAIRDPRMRIGLLLARPTRLCWLNARRVRAWSVHPALRYATAPFIEAAHRRGYRVIPYTVNAPEDLARLRHLGADGVFTDFPDRVASGAA